LIWIPSHFLLMLLLLHQIFFSITYFLYHDGKGENSAHRLSLAIHSHCSLANTKRQQQVCFEGELSLCSPFLLCFLLHLIFILFKYSLFSHGNGENAAHRLSLVTFSYHCLAITERQQWVYFEGKFS
jgi:hypothetical protein